MLIRRYLFTVMKNIKKVTIVILFVMMMLIPNTGYAETLRQVLNQNSENQITTVQKEESVNPAITFNQLTESHLQKIKSTLDDIKVQIEVVHSNAEQQVKGQQIADATYSVPSAGEGWCAAWVSQCYQAAGFGYPGGDADDMYWNFCHSSNRDDIVPGMIIAVPSHTRTGWSGQRYGHVGIIVERDGQYYVRDNIGYVNEQTLEEWINYYGTSYIPQWGFAGDI